jgi:hypothetical protein
MRSITDIDQQDDTSTSKQTRTSRKGLRLINTRRKSSLPHET